MQLFPGWKLSEGLASTPRSETGTKGCAQAGFNSPCEWISALQWNQLIIRQTPPSPNPPPLPILKWSLRETWNYNQCASEVTNQLIQSMQSPSCCTFTSMSFGKQQYLWRNISVTKAGWGHRVTAINTNHERIVTFSLLHSTHVSRCRLPLRMDYA